MGEFFKSNDYGRILYKHESLPIYATDEFDFYRCVEFDDCFYGKTVSELHSGNLRQCKGRYSCLFPNQKISYWADSPKTARAEIQKHGAGKSIITFWAYDDATSTIPIMDEGEGLIIVDGRKCGIQEIIDKIDEGKNLSNKEKDEMNQILDMNPDCLVYDSRAYPGGENYIFLEKGFKKLAIRQLKLYLGNRNAKNTQAIDCAYTCDYMPHIKNYGCYFTPIAQIGISKEYMESMEYKNYKRNYDQGYSRLSTAHKNNTRYDGNAI